MIPNEETASIARDRYMSIEAMRQRGMNDTSDDQRYLKNFVDFVLTKNNAGK